VSPILATKTARAVVHPLACVNGQWRSVRNQYEVAQWLVYVHGRGDRVEFLAEFDYADDARALARLINERGSR
jgi:hypothetical protein